MPTATGAPPLAFFYGEDAWSIERAARDYRAALEAGAGSQFDIWRAPGGDDDDGGGGSESAATNDGAGKKKARVTDEIAQHVATATLFGGGTLVIVRQPGWLLRESASRERLIKMLAEVAPGNALCFTELRRAGRQADRAVSRDAQHHRGARRPGQGVRGTHVRAHGGLDRRARARARRDPGPGRRAAASGTRRRLRARG